MRGHTFAALVLLSSSASAEEQRPVGGYGALPCSEAIQAPLDDPSTIWALRDWTAGFVSGINVTLSAERHRHFDLHGPWANVLYLKLLEGCRDRPNDMFADLVLEEIARMPQAPD